MKLTRTFAGLGSGLLVGTATLVLGTGVAQASQGTEHGGGSDAAHNKVTICHATGSSTNPYVVITPDAAGVANGHYDHQDVRDIIPPFSYDGTAYSGHNFDADGQATYDNGCTPKTQPQPQPMPQPMPQPVPQPEPQPMPQPETGGTTPTGPGTGTTPPLTIGTTGTPTTGTTTTGTTTPGTTTPGTTTAGTTAGTAPAATTSTGTSSTTTSTHVVPSSSTHAGRYDAGWNTAQQGGVALAAAGALAGLGAVIRRRLVRQ